MQLSSILVLQTPVVTKLLEEASITLDELSSDEDDSSGLMLDELSDDDDSAGFTLEELISDEDDFALLLLDSTLLELDDSFTFTELEELSILVELEDTSVFDELDDSTFLELEDFSELDGANALSLEDNSVTLLDDSASLTEELDSKSSILLEIAKAVSLFDGPLELSSPQATKLIVITLTIAINRLKYFIFFIFFFCL